MWARVHSLCVYVRVWHAPGLRLSGPKKGYAVPDSEFLLLADIGVQALSRSENWVAAASRCLVGRTNAAPLSVLCLKGWTYRDSILEPLLPCMRSLRVSGHSMSANVRVVCERKKQNGRDVCQSMKEGKIMVASCP